MNKNFSPQFPSEQATLAVDAVDHQTVSTKLNCASQSRSVSTPETNNFCVDSLSNSENHQSGVELAINICKTCNFSLIKALPDFLLILPSLIDLEQVLTTAIYRLGEFYPDTGGWLSRHPTYLMLEFNLVELARKLALFNLENIVLVPQGNSSLEANSTRTTLFNEI